MSAIKLSTPSSGSISLSPANTASNLVITVPALTATMAINGPAFSAYSNANQTLTNNVASKILFQVELFDTNNNFSSSTFTPTVAGYYQLNCAIKMQNPGATGTMVCDLFKNGSVLHEGQSTFPSGYNVNAEISCLVYANGTTDYFEIYGLQVTGGSQTIVHNGTIATWFNGSLVRAA